MTQKMYELLEGYMLSCMGDSAPRQRARLPGAVHRGFRLRKQNPEWTGIFSLPPACSTTSAAGNSLKIRSCATPW